MRAPLLALMAMASLVLTACPFGGDSDDTESTATAPIETPTPTTPTAVATASPTPNPLAQLPTTQQEALSWLKIALAGSKAPGCPEQLQLGKVLCLLGNLDGDATQDAAYLVPVKLQASTLPHPAAVFIWSGRSQKLEEFATDLTADASILGLAFFEVAERNGDARAEIAYLKNSCGATTCNTRAVVLSWDGTAWRDIAAPDTVSNVDKLGWEGTGAASVLEVHGGKLPEDAPKDAGPSRAATISYGLKSGMYVRTAIERDPPEYLYHAIQDADELFEIDRAAAMVLYRSAASNAELKDWKRNDDDPDRRPTLKGYALWRIALATAVLGNEPSIALDEVITGSEEPLFDNVADVFRREFLEGRGVLGGCAAVNLYLRTPAPGTDTPRYVEDHFDYGYANPPGSSWIDRICPF